MSRLTRYIVGLSLTNPRRFNSFPSLARKMSAFKDISSEIIETPKHEKIDGVFVNPWGNGSFLDGFKLLLTMKYQSLKLPNNVNSISTIPAVRFDKEKINSINPHFSWLGHATCYFQTDGVYFLTDPIFSQRASMSQWFGPARFTPTPVTVPDLEKIDVVMLSHTHYDHMDADTVNAIGNKPLWVVPLGVKDLLKDSFGITNCVELGWWESHHFTSPHNNVDIEIAFTPTKHWTARTAFDRNTCLWGSYSVLSPTSRFFFTGDTAYDENLFKAVGKKYGPYDLAAVPIGAYAPRWFMKHVHCNPEEAVQIHKDLRAKQSVGIHWGTFRLTEEDPIEPALELARLRVENNIPASEFFTVALGETVEVGRTSSNDMGVSRPDLYKVYIDSLVSTAGKKSDV